MNCLHCGDCCLRMSPKSTPDPCPDIIQDGTFYFCRYYERRPEACVNHSFHSRYCPIGFEKLGLKNPQDVAQRIDVGFELIMQYNHLEIEDRNNITTAGTPMIRQTCPKCNGTGWVATDWAIND